VAFTKDQFNALLTGGEVFPDGSSQRFGMANAMVKSEYAHELGKEW
jgi:hypothetical protein